MTTSDAADSGVAEIDERTDGELLAAHVAGDHDAFGVLFARHRDRLWAVALRTTGNPDDAADGLQDGMVAAYRRAGSFRGEAQVTTWLHRVVVNACLDRLRAMKVRRAEPLPDDLEEYGDRGSRASSTEASDDPAEASVRSDERRRVHEALRSLPVDQRAAIVLVDLEGHPVADAAAMLGCPAGTVKSRCSRGRARLAVLLADLLDGAEDGADLPAPAPGNRPASGAVRSSSTPRAPPPAADDPPGAR
jgi:RNA polymerase sigma-70 factor, ECF subfamily